MAQGQEVRSTKCSGIKNEEKDSFEVSAFFKQKKMSHGTF
jgi:hypothetical protein